jgi:hypothetical protein
VLFARVGSAPRGPASPGVGSTRRSRREHRIAPTIAPGLRRGHVGLGIPARLARASHRCFAMQTHTNFIAISLDNLGTVTGGYAATNPWATFGTDLKGRIDGELAAARTRFDHYKPTMPTIPSAPSVPSIPSVPSKYSHCFPTPTQT